MFSWQLASVMNCSSLLFINSMIQQYFHQKSVHCAIKFVGTE
jgi:hypothetical protein